MLELLNQLDGFDSRGDVKVIMATNKIETLDPALIRPGRIDRKIEFPYVPFTPAIVACTDEAGGNSLPDIKTKRYIFKIHTARMSLAPDVDLEEFVHTKDDLSGADIKAVCTEAGLLALRERRMQVKMSDMVGAREKVLFMKKDDGPAGLCESNVRFRGEQRLTESEQISDGIRVRSQYSPAIQLCNSLSHSPSRSSTRPSNANNPSD